MSSFECNTPTTSESSSTCTAELGPTGKRLDYITWHQHHMYVARMLSEMSSEKQPVGCYIVSEDNYQIVSGYSGEITAKENSCSCAIYSALQKLKRKSKCGENCIMYISSFPDCGLCMREISTMPIAKIWYWSLPNNSDIAEIYNILRKNGIEHEKYIPTRTISIDFTE